MTGSAGSSIQAVDWSAPWLAPWSAAGQALLQGLQGGVPVSAALNAMPAAPVRFVPQCALPEDTAYEQFIFDTGCVPTRDNLHDFFNGLVWLRFPQAKQRLNQLQAGALAAQGVGAVRGPLRDALTLFDENGALLAAPGPLWQALEARDWQRLCIDLRPLWAQARLVLFGHALLEKLVSPRKPITAHVYRAPAALENAAINDLDTWLAQAMEPGAWARKPFAPLPVLGVPGWWPQNAEPGFYADAQVFRPARHAP